jgi:hypothetical protein
MLPGQAQPNNLVGQSMDAATTAVSAVGLGILVGLLDKPIGHQLRFGGITFAVAKLISAVVPNFSLSAKFPDIWNLSLSPTSAAPAAPAALPPGSALSAVAPASVGMVPASNTSAATAVVGGRPAGF